MSRIFIASFVLLGMPLGSCVAEDADADFPSRVAQAVKRALPLLETASAETSRQRKCFTCHGQAMPIVALVEARKHGFEVDTENLQRQLDHTYAHLERSKEKYADGRGTGGQVDTAGWALWGLEAGDREADEVTDTVVQYLIGKQDAKGVWKCSSNRPPSEKSHFATTYLALRGFESYARSAHDEDVNRAREKATEWFADATPSETEDRVFQLLSLPYVGLDDRADDLIDQLKAQQRPGGGWAQLPDLDADPYATATVLYALGQAGMDWDQDVYRRGLEFLIDQQQDDGSWHVASRSKPFQAYFETGYPHGKDQFISTTAACWATIALLHALPEKSPEPNELERTKRDD